MSPFSKLMISFLLVSCIALLIFPVSTIGAISSSEPSLNNPVFIDPETMGIKLELDIEVIVSIEGNKEKSSSQVILWNKSGDKATVKIDSQIEIELTTKSAPNESVLIESKIYQIKPDHSRDLKAVPRVRTKNGSLAVINMSSDHNGNNDLSWFSMKVLPSKIKYSEFNP